MTRKKKQNEVEGNEKYLNRIKNDLDNIGEAIERIEGNISCLDFNYLRQELVIRDVKANLNSIKQAIDYKWDIS